MSAENRAAAGVSASEEVEVEIELDTAPREVVVPEDFAAALAAAPTARAFFESLSFSQKQWYVLGVEDAKTSETRQRRIVKAIDRLNEGASSAKAPRRRSKRPPGSGVGRDRAPPEGRQPNRRASV